MLRTYIREVLIGQPVLTEGAEMTEPLLKWLIKRTKKAKGVVQMPMVESAFELMEGWSITDTTTFLILNSYGGDDILAALLQKKGVAVRSYSLSSSVKEPHYLPAELREKFIGAVDTSTSSKAKLPSGEAVVGQVYATTPSGVMSQGKYGREGESFTVNKVWLGVPGWTVTSPNGKSVVLPHPMDDRTSRRGQPADPNRLEKFVKFWTWTYKNGLADSAKQALDAHDPDAVAMASATGEKRKQLQARRIMLPEVEKLLREIVNDKFEEVWEHLTKSHLNALDFYIKSSMKDGKRVRSYTITKNKWLSYYMSFIQKATDDDFYSNEPPQRKKDAEDIARKDAKKLAERIRESFVYKNGSKLSMIIKEKGNLKGAKVTQVLPGNDFGGEILVTFKDGSRFTVRNKTVWKISQLGKGFEQYPTTFHNVVMSDGSKMGKPSEKRMVDVFTAKGK